MPPQAFVFFWRSDSPFSQWHLSAFTVDGINFNCAEQYMMYHKAMLFGDEETAQKILKTTSPHQQKALGRKVRNFVEQTWLEERENIVYQGNHAKFSQNPDLKAHLLATGDCDLVEASPVDTVWGVGLAEDHPDIVDPSKWRGLNLLGKILTRIRNELRIHT